MASATALPALQASAAPNARAGQVGLTAPASGTRLGQDVSSRVSPSWQTSGTVWALAAVHGVIYVGGNFTSVRPPGVALNGAGQKVRTDLAAFNASTGALIKSFDPTLDGEVNALAVSPDGSTLYVGGHFTHADGSFHEFLAAFSTSTGALISTWDPAASGSVLSIAPSPNGSEIYIGGNFAALDTVARTRAGAVDSATGALLPWAPALNGTVTSVAVAPDDSRVLVGGYFTTFNGVTQQGIGSTDPATGASELWALPPMFEPNHTGCLANVKDIVISGSVAYAASEGTGGGCFDGDYAVNVSDGSLVWQNDCLGATQALVVLNGVLYKGSHAHDCAYAPDGFPQVANPSGGWFTHRLLDQSLTNGAVGHWTPNTNGNNLGPRVMATDGKELFVGGDFTTVNNHRQQGFARFEPGPDTTTPPRPGAPTVISTSAGVDSVTFTAVSDSDDGSLAYAIYRDGGKKPVGTIHATSWPWALPVLHFRESHLRPGRIHTYTVTASDSTTTSAHSPASAPVKVTGKNPTLSYYRRVLGAHPSFFWKLNERSGSTAFDATPNGFKGSYQPGTTHGVAGPVTGNPDTAASFDGRTGLVTAAQSVLGPQRFSIEGWFRTSTSTGGKLIGFGSSQTGLSTSYDRQIYMMNNGQLVFGVFNSTISTIETPRVYNDGNWHYVVATLGPTGMALYVDGHLIGTNPNHAAQSYSGFWRVGGDNLKGGWNLDFWGSNSQGTTQPNSYYLAGTIADVAVYPYAMTAAEVGTHYAANALSH